MTSLPEDFRFHHLGVACDSLEGEFVSWRSLGYRPEGATFVDEAQGIRGQFLVGGGPRLELLEATEGSATLAPWLKRRVKFYHAGYLVGAFDRAMDALARRGARVAREPAPSVYFGARIAFLMMPNMALIEVIEDLNWQETSP